MDSHLYFISTPHHFPDLQGRTISERFYYILRDQGMSPRGIYLWKETDLYENAPTRFPFYNLMVLCDSGQTTKDPSDAFGFKIIELPDKRWFDIVQMKNNKKDENGCSVFTVDSIYCKVKPDSRCGDEFSYLFRLAVETQNINNGDVKTVIVKPTIAWQ